MTTWNEINDKVQAAERLTYDEGVWLFEQRDVIKIGKLAQVVRQFARSGHVAGRGHHHDLHGTKGSHKQAPQGRATFLAPQGLPGLRRIRRRTVSSLLDRCNQILGLCPMGIPLH